jgi:hypothetical protein
MAPQIGGYQGVPLQDQGGYAQTQSYQQDLQGPQANAFTAPQTIGPYQERMSAEDLRILQPRGESFTPEGSLNFAPATPPSGLPIETYGSVQGTGTGQGTGSWYYPGSVSSRNRFYVQTASGLKTVAGCNYGGHMPLWSDINSAGNFYVYEWYPGQTTPSVRWWGWTWPGFKRGWFSGDVPGWHILSYNCRDWSNYVYIYVWPGAAVGGYSGGPYAQGQGPAPSAALSASLPAGAPTPPDPNAENLILPDFKLFQPVASQGGYPAQGSYPAQGGYSAQGSYPVQGGYPAQSIPPGQSGCSGPDCLALGGTVAPQGYPAQNYQAVFPKLSSCRCNEYFIQTAPGKLGTVGGVRCGEWMPLWSKISRPGVYWSFEWSQCSLSSYCPPEVKNFGYKGMGWYQTWFRGNKPGWHIMSYCCNDWSNYIYIYVWPSS